MNCPICAIELNMTERQGIEIDYCPKCRGVWLDRGELDKLIERANNFNTQEKNYYPNHDHDNNKQYKKGYKSFLHELFD